MMSGWAQCCYALPVLENGLCCTSSFRQLSPTRIHPCFPHHQNNAWWVAAARASMELEEVVHAACASMPLKAYNTRLRNLKNDFEVRRRDTYSRSSLGSFHLSGTHVKEITPLD